MSGLDRALAGRSALARVAQPGMSLTELIGIAIGCMLIALGFGSIAAWLLRRRAAERLLLLFGIWCLLYGLRLVAL